MKPQKLTILHLYPKEMNLYGDHGNILALKRRCEWRNIETEIINYELGDEFPAKVDLIFGGGGQDSGQEKIAEDFLSIKPRLEKLIKSDTPALFVCGLYQLMGKEFITLTDETIPGLNIFKVSTKGSSKRIIGNAVINSPAFGEIVGYENHSGRTTLSSNMRPLGHVKKGGGNNGHDRTEGVFYKNTIGTYLHGPLLPKNPRITDFLIQSALDNKYGKTTLSPLDNKYENLAHRSSTSRPR